MDSLKKKKKRPYGKLAAWLIADLTIALVLIGLLLHKPAGYEPVKLNTGGDAPEHIHRYLTHLGSELYNGAQATKSFGLEVIEAGINQAIAQSNWPKQSEGIAFSLPKATFSQDGITLMGTANIEGVDLVVTIAGRPSLMDDGRLRLQLRKVKIGAMSVTPMARIIARKMYRDQLNYMTVDSDDLRTKIAAALIDDQPFDPVFNIEGRMIRLTDLSLAQGKLILRFMPIGRRTP